MAKTQRHVIDFGSAEETDLHRIEIPLEFHMLTSGMVHGLAFWFDVAFIGSGATVWLSTAPTEALTHWYQVSDTTHRGKRLNLAGAFLNDCDSVPRQFPAASNSPSNVNKGPKPSHLSQGPWPVDCHWALA